MQVVDVHLVLDGVVAVVVGGAVAGCPALTPPPASHMVKPSGLWSRPSFPSAVGRAAELAAPEDQRVVEQAPRLQVLEQAGDRLVDLAGVLLVPFLEVAVLVPLHERVAVRDLDEPHAALGEPAGQQALAAEVRGDRVVQAVQP